MLFHLFLTLFTLHAQAQDLTQSLGVPYDQEAKESIRKIKEEAIEKGTSAMLRASATWQNRCAGKGNEFCFLKECDLEPKNCRPDRVLLFRGEVELFDLPATSALLRARFKGSAYAKNEDAVSLLQTFKNDFLDLRQTEFAPQHENFVLHQTLNKSQWFSEKLHQRIPSPIKDQILYPFLPLLYGYHAEGDGLYFKDPVLSKEVNIDPLVSFSVNPDVAQSFTHHGSYQGTARVIVLSVPIHEISPLCETDAFYPGQILDPSRCKDIGTEYEDELELDAVLYPKPDQVYQTYLLH